MTFVLGLTFLLAAVNVCVNGAPDGLPFQVNEKKTCDTKISIDSKTLTGVQRGDEDALCSGYLMHTDNGKTRRMCGGWDYVMSEWSAERACYTLGVSFFRDSEFDSSKTRQMKLFNCFSYKEQGVDSVEENGKEEVFRTYDAFDDWTEAICTDTEANPEAYNCFDECYLKGPTDLVTFAPNSGLEEDCQPGEPFFAIGCADINECESGVRDYCTGPYESSCTIRKACGNNTDCTNYAGSFECTCKNGYEFRSGDDFDPYDLKEGCRDVDECKRYPSPCDADAKCINTIGSYLCLCSDGYVGDGKICTLPNNCYAPGFCKNGECQLIKGGTVCVCDDGYTGFRCEIQTTSTALILSIIAVVLFGVLLIVLLVVLCMRCCTPPPKSPPMRPPPQSAVMVSGPPFPTKTYGVGQPTFTLPQHMPKPVYECL